MNLLVVASKPSTIYLDVVYIVTSSSRPTPVMNDVAVELIFLIEARENKLFGNINLILQLVKIIVFVVKSFEVEL